MRISLPREAALLCLTGLKSSQRWGRCAAGLGCRVRGWGMPYVLAPPPGLGANLPAPLSSLSWFDWYEGLPGGFAWALIRVVAGARVRRRSARLDVDLPCSAMRCCGVRRAEELPGRFGCAPGALWVSHAAAESGQVGARFDSAWRGRESPCPSKKQLSEELPGGFIAGRPCFQTGLGFRAARYCGSVVLRSACVSRRALYAGRPGGGTTLGYDMDYGTTWECGTALPCGTAQVEQRGLPTGQRTRRSDVGLGRGFKPAGRPQGRGRR